MRIRLPILLLFLILHLTAKAQLVPNLGGQRAGISALQFLKIGIDGRGAALGEAVVANSYDAASLYWNPAGIALAKENSAMVSHAEWLVEMKHDYVGAIYKLSSADAVGVSVISLSTDDMQITTETRPFGTGEYFRYSDLAVGVTYARQMTDRFAFGATVRYVRETLHLLKMETVLMDLGTHYDIGLGGMRFGVVVSNFGSDVSPEGEIELLSGDRTRTFQSFSPPTVFKVGFAFDPYFDETQRVSTSVQLNHPNDNAEQVRVGIEYAWREWLFVRAGLKRTIGESMFGRDTKSLDDFSVGVGAFADLGFSKARFDYGYTNFNNLGGTHRVSLSMSY
ncbi:MAG: PorV/PorQ family protein [Ignavibacteria bacterium]|nr:PorV/PorQ family protein [Ignavibacteria bacterium]